MDHRNTPPLCFHERRILYRGKIIKLAPFTVTSHSISVLVKAIGTSEQTLYNKTVYATPKMMTFG